MCATAGAEVHAVNPYYANLAIVVLLATVVHRCKLGRRGKKGLDAHVLANGRVGAPLNVEHVIVCKETVEVDLDAALSHVKANVVVAKEGMHDARDNVLAGVRLHVVSPPGPVQRPVDAGTNGKRDVCEVNDLARAITGYRFAHMGNEAVFACANAQCAPITRLSAACGIKRGLVKLNRKPLICRLTGHNRGIELSRVGLPIVQLIKRFHNSMPPCNWHLMRVILTAAHDRRNWDKDGPGCRVFRFASHRFSGRRLFDDTGIVTWLILTSSADPPQR